MARQQGGTVPQYQGDVRVPGSVGSAPQVSGDRLQQAASQTSGASEVLGQASKLFAGMADQVGQIADDAARVAGEQQGASAGLDPEFRPRGDNTIFGRAYDQAALQTFKGQMSIKLHGQLGAAFDKSPSDPIALNQAMQEVRNGWVENMDRSVAPLMLPHFEAAFARTATELNREATRNQIKIADQEQRATLDAEIKMHVGQVERLGYRLGLDARADEVLAGEMSTMRERLSQVAADGRPLILPAVREKALRDAEQEIARSRIIGAFDRLQTLPEKQAFIDKVEKDYQSGGNPLLENFDPAHYETLVSKLYSTAKRHELGAAENASRARKMVDDADKSAKEGIPLTPEQRQNVLSTVIQYGKPEDVDKFRRSEATLAMLQEFNVTPPDMLEARVRRERQRLTRDGAGAGEWERERLKLAEGYIEAQKAGLSQNMLGVAAKAGVASVAPLDLSAPDKFASTLANRMPEAETVAGFYRRDVQYFTPEEKAELGSIGRKGGASLVGLASSIVRGAGDKAPEVLKQVAKEASEVAVIGQLHLAGSAEKTIQDAANGIALRQHEDFKQGGKALAPKGEVAMLTGKEVFGDVFRTDPEAQSTALSLANAIYEVRARQRQVDTFDKNLWSQGLREVLGERTVDGVKAGGLAYQQAGWLWGGSKPVLIPANIRQDKFAQVLDVVAIEDLTTSKGAVPMDGKNRPLDMAALRAGRLMTVGQGKYMIQTGQDHDGRAEVAYRDGRPFVLDLFALEPALRQRRPDLYVPGGR